MARGEDTRNHPNRQVSRGLIKTVDNVHFVRFKKPTKKDNRPYEEDDSYTYNGKDMAPPRGIKRPKFDDEE